MSFFGKNPGGFKPLPCIATGKHASGLTWYVPLLHCGSPSRPFDPHLSESGVPGLSTVCVLLHPSWRMVHPEAAGLVMEPVPWLAQRAAAGLRIIHGENNGLHLAAQQVAADFAHAEAVYPSSSTAGQTQCSLLLSGVETGHIPETSCLPFVALAVSVSAPMPTTSHQAELSLGVWVQNQRWPVTPKSCHSPMGLASWQCVPLPRITKNLAPHQQSPS